MADLPFASRLAAALVLNKVVARDDVAFTEWEGVSKRYKMLGYAANSNLADTWYVSGSPDYTGSRYHGPLSTPLRNITILESYDTSPP